MGLIRVVTMMVALSIADNSSSNAFVVDPPTTTPSRSFYRTARYLFFADRKKKAPPEASFMTDLKSPTITLPYTFTYQSSSSNKEEILTVRHLETTDLKAFVPICVEEFSPESSFPRLNNISFQTLKQWVDNMFFPFLISLSLEMKILRRIQGDVHELEPDYNVLCLSQSGDDDNVIGIVELSRQPLDPHRNPPPVPLPIAFKEAYAETNHISPRELNAWVTNLLVAPQYRQKGYSKILMAAVQGLALKWNLTSIHLHVDAMGKIPQRLYESLGYKPVHVISKDDAAKFEWMGPEIIKTGLCMVEGVPLLFLEKELV